MGLTHRTGAPADYIIISNVYLSSIALRFTFSLIISFHRKLAPVRRALAVVEGVMAADTTSQGSAAGLAALGHCVAMASISSTSMAFESPDPSYRTLPCDTLESLIQPIWYLESLAKRVGSIPFQVWVISTGGDVACAKGRIVYRMNSMLKMLDACAYMVGHAMLHPQGMQLVEQGKAPVRALGEALWALAPLLSWDLGESCLFFALNLAILYELR